MKWSKYTFLPSVRVSAIINDMSCKTVNDAVITVNYDPELVERVLLDAERLPTWNPAFTEVIPRETAGEYDVVIHRRVKGVMTQVRLDERTISFHIAIPGLREDSTFRIDQTGRGTEVRHTVTQEGLLASLIGDEEASRVPGKRLGRLARALEGLS